MEIVCIILAKRLCGKIYSIAVAKWILLKQFKNVTCISTNFVIYAIDPWPLLDVWRIHLKMTSNMFKHEKVSTNKIKMKYGENFTRWYTRFDDKDDLYWHFRWLPGLILRLFFEASSNKPFAYFAIILCISVYFWEFKEFLHKSAISSCKLIGIQA